MKTSVSPNGETIHISEIDDKDLSLAIVAEVEYTYKIWRDCK